MKNVTSHKGMLTVVERDRSSSVGNPRYVVLLDGIVCRTMVDSSLGYSICTFDGCLVKADIGTHYGTVSIENVRRIEK